MCECLVSSVMSDSLQPHGLEPARLLYLWDYPSKNTGVVSMPSYGGSSWPRDRTRLSCIIGRFFTTRHLGSPSPVFLGFSCGSAGKEFFCSAGDLGLIPGSGRSPGEGKGYPLQYSGLENSMGCIGHGVSNSWTQLSNFHTSCTHLGSPNVLQRFYNFLKSYASVFLGLLCFECVLSHFSPVWLFVTPWTVAHQAPLSMGFSRQEYWSGLQFSSPGDLPDPGIKPTSLYISCVGTSTAWINSNSVTLGF